MNKRIAITKTFTIVGPNAAKDHVHEFTEFVAAGTFADPTAEEKGLCYFERDSDGAKLNRVSDTEFEVVSTGERIAVAG